MENKRTIIAVVLMMILWSVYTMYFSPQQVQQDVVAEETIVSTSAVNPSSLQTPAPVESQFVADAAVEVVDETNIKIISENYTYFISSVGASIESVSLSKYREENTPDSDFQYLYSADSSQDVFSIYGSDGLYVPKNLNYSLPPNLSDEVVVTDGKVDIPFTAYINGIQVVKTYTFYSDNYNFDLNITVTNASEKEQHGRINLIVNNEWNEDDTQYRSFHGPMTFVADELQEDDVDKLTGSPKIYADGTLWSGYATKYFLTAVAPNNFFSQVTISLKNGVINNLFTSELLSLNPGDTSTLSYSSYVGPKVMDELNAAGHGFEESIHYGLFSPICKPLMSVIRFFYGFLGNYGFAIILLTICIKLIFWPLTQKSYKSMKGMQKLQPEMKRMREKHGSDKQKLNQEMMKFYKENKVNPLGGCLPMLIQIPVFFALYRVLLSSIELRHAPFMLWLTDLSAKDPYYVTPIIMGVTMFLQQKMTPTSLDPMQEKMMLFLPIIFTFMFLNFPSGLVIYWLVNNLLTILQQYLIRRQAD
jgi:YidC/Oxa1 family membrane protein insertase